MAGKQRPDGAGLCRPLECSWSLSRRAGEKNRSVGHEGMPGPCVHSRKTTEEDRLGGDLCGGRKDT